MTLSHSLLSYQDCTEAMDLAMDDPRGGRVRFRDLPSAQHFRARCHQARMIIRNQNKKIYDSPDHPLHGSCTYDVLVLRLKRGPGESWVIDLEKMTADTIVVEPLSEAPALLPQPKPTLQLAPPTIEILPPKTDGMKRRL